MRRWNIIAVAIIVLMMTTLVFSPVAVQARPIVSGTISGYVTDSSTGKPVYNAYVEIPYVSGYTGTGIGTYSDQTGHYSLAYRVEGGGYTVRISHIGHSQQSTSVTFTGGVITRNFQMSRSAGVSGYIYDTNNAPISGMSIGFTNTLYSSSMPSLQYSTTTDLAGFYYQTNYFYVNGPWYEILQKATCFTHIRGIGTPSLGSVCAADSNVQQNFLSTIIVAALYVHQDDTWSDVSWTESLSYLNTYMTTISRYGSVFLGLGSDKQVTLGTSYMYSDLVVRDTGYVMTQDIWMTGVSRMNAGQTKNTVLNIYPVPNAPASEVHFTNNDYDDIQLVEPTMTYPPTIMPLDGVQVAMSNSGTSIHTMGADVSISLGAAFFSTTVFSMHVSRSDSSSTTTEMTITFTHNGPSTHNHTFRVYYQNNGAAGLIVHIWGQN
jgi:hypothetical protein